MRISLTSLKGTQIIDQDGIKQAVFLYPVFNMDNGMILAFMVRKNENKKLILPVDVCTIKNNGIYLSNNAEFHSPSDIVRVHEALKVNQNLLGRLVESQNGERIGKVKDCILNLKAMTLSQLDVVQRSFFSRIGSTLIAQEDIVEIKPKKIIIKSGIIKNALKSQVYESQPA